MKKIFVCLLSVAAIAACQKNQVLETVVGPEIAFENASVDYQTRAAVDPSTTTASIDKFSVWGYMDERNGAIFNEELVSRSGAAWTYANTQYWLAGHTYYFAAVSPVKADNVVVTPETATTAGDYGLGKIDFTNTDGSTDLIYASAMVEAAAGADLSAMPKVGLSFSHLLSKVKFTFTNGFENPNSTIIVSNIKMTAPKTGSIDLNVENWWDNDDWKLGSESVTLDFGAVNGGNKLAAGATDECADERLTIPASADQKYVITFDVELFNGEVSAVKNTGIEAIVTGAPIEMGKAYNFKAEINATNINGAEGEQLYPIEFEVVEVKEWEQAEQVATILGDVAEGDALTLVTDAVAPKTVNVAGTLDGAGNTVTIEKGTADFLYGGTLRLIQTNKGATIKNVTIDGNHAKYENYGIRGVFMTGEGEVNLENVTIQNVTYTLNDDTAAKTLNVVNSTLNGWTSYDSNTVGHFTNVAFGEGDATGFRPHGAAYLTDCTFSASTGFPIYLDKVNTKCYVAGVIDGNGAKVTVCDKRVDNGIIRPVGNTTIKNLTITGGEDFATADGAGLRAIYITNGGEYVLDGVTITGVTYAFNVNTTQPVTLVVKNSTLQGWVSYGNSTTASFENVDFICGGNFADNFKPYTSVVLTDCTFEAGFQIDFTSLDGVITFKNCTYNGTVLTAENFATVAKTDGEYAGKIAF